MNQLSFTFQESKTNNLIPFQKIDDLFKRITRELYLTEGSLYLRDNKRESPNATEKASSSGFSICFYEVPYPLESKSNLGVSKSIMALKEQKFKTKESVIVLKVTSLHDIALIPETASYKANNDGSYMISFSPYDNNMLDFIEEYIRWRYAHYISESSFGCCSKFNLCSDEKRCVHENQLYAKGCMYRASLDSGKIFYGKNRNV